jgi:hypothetical protein
MRIGDLETLTKFHDKLNPDLWEGNRLKPQVRLALFKIAKAFVEFINVEDLELTDITISGSNASFNYNNKSDIDLHLIANSNGPCKVNLKDLFQAKKVIFNDQHDITILGHAVEVYVQGSEDAHISNGVYSVYDDNWVAFPKKITAKPDITNIEHKFEHLEEEIKQALESGDPQTIARLKKRIKDMRQSGLEKNGEFGVENLAFKLLRNTGLIQKLYDAETFETDKELSLGQQGVAEGFLNESAYEEAWELISQPVPEIQQFVKQLGLAQDDTTAKQIAPMIDATPDTQLPAASIPKLKNLANKGNDVQTLKAIEQISGRPDVAQQYAKIMQSRDAGEGRQRGYDVSGLINSVKSGNYEAPVLLKLATGTYVIGGRTRLYAALALGIPAKVKIISVSTFVKQGQQGVAEGTEQSLSSMVSQDQSERNEYKNFVKSQAGGDWSKGAKMYAQLKKRPSNDIFGDASRLNQFMKMKFDFDKFTDEDWDNYWLLAQHCDYNRDFQKNALSIIKKYQGTDHSHYKYLYDRISMGLTGKQKYGTQNVIEQGVAEGNQFTGALAKARAEGLAEFTVGGKTFKVKNSKKIVKEAELTEKWSKKYKRSIDCSHPKGFSQKAHCAGRRKKK